MATRAETGFIADLPVDDNTGRFPPGPLSLDGQLLSIRKPGATVLWNVEHRAPVLTLPQLWGAHSFSDDGRWFLAGTVQGIPLHPRLCDLSTTPPDVREYTALPPGWTAYNLSPDGRYFVAGGVTESGLRLVDTATLATVTDYHYPADFRLRGMVWNASSQFFLSCSNTGHIACWYPRKPDPAWILPAHTGDVYPPALFNNDTGMATTGSDGLIKFWNLTTHQAAGSLPLRALALHASRDGTRLLADDPDHRQRPLFDCTPSTVAAILKLPADPVRNVYTPGTPWLAALAGGGFAVTGGFDLHSTGADGDSLAPALVSPQNDAAALDEAGRRFFRRTGTRLTVMPLPVAPGPANFLAQARRALRGLGLPIAAPADSSATPPSWPVALGSTLAFDPLSRRLLTGGSDGLALWQFPPTGLLSTPVPLAAAGLEPKASVTALRWSPRGHYLAWSGTRPALDDPKKKRRGTWLVDTASGRETGALFGDAPVTALLFTPDETLLIAATPGEIRCAATATGALRWSHPHHRPAATPPALAVAENAPLAAITLEPETIALLDPATGTIRYRLTHPVTRTVRTLAFNADATRLAAIAGNFLQTWKLDTIARILHEQGME